jgi:hypothetical protein
MTVSTQPVTAAYWVSLVNSKITPRQKLYLVEFNKDVLSTPTWKQTAIIRLSSIGNSDIGISLFQEYSLFCIACLKGIMKTLNIAQCPQNLK